MSSTVSDSQATSSPIPLRFQSEQKSSAATEKPTTVPPIKLRLKVEDLSSTGSHVFLSTVNAGTVLEDAVRGVLGLLYTPRSKIPGTRSVTLILRSMPGVAYTTGSSLDNDHKEIHLSTDYIQQLAKNRCRDEILGVIRHEMVHCWQWNGRGSAPGGLIEGIADWVRLRSGFVPPHWKRGGADRWDAGYQHTGYFLDYLEDSHGDGSVVVINGWLSGHQYDDKMWKELFKTPIEKLWKDYCKSLGMGTTKAEPEPVSRENCSGSSSDTDEIQTPEPESPGHEETLRIER